MIFYFRINKNIIKENIYLEIKIKNYENLIKLNLYFPFDLFLKIKSIILLLNIFLIIMNLFTNFKLKILINYL